MTPRKKLLAQIAKRPGQLYRAVGRVVHWERERSHSEKKIDHVWLTLEAGSYGLLRASISTYSSRNADAGFDPHVRLGVVREDFRSYPQEGVFPHNGLDYGRIDRDFSTGYDIKNKGMMEKELLGRASRCVIAEVWGHIYARHHLGIHNVHSMRKSCAVDEDRVGSDGAIKFYYSTDRQADLLLIKFCGQP